MGFTIWLTFTTGGGWSQVFTVKMDEELDGRGQLFQLCPNPNPKFQGLHCKSRDAFYADVFTVINGVGSAGVLFFGMIMDPWRPFCGPKVAALIGQSLVAIGFYLLATVDSDTQSVSMVKTRIMIGATFIYTGPTGALISAMPMVNYFNKAFMATLIAVIQVGSYLSGMSSLFGFWILEKANVSVEYRRKYFCLFFMFVNLFNLCIVLLIYPTRSIR